MAAAQPVLDKKIELIPNEIIKNILVIDDDADFLESMKVFFAQTPFVSLQTCEKPEKAHLLLEDKNFDIVIVDFNFENSRITGDRFVIENMQSYFPKAFVIVVTGKTENLFVVQKNLQRFGVKVVNKDTPWEERVNVEINKAYGEFVNDVNERLEGVAYAQISDNNSSELMDGVEDMFVDWLSTIPDQQSKYFLLDSKSLNSSELLREIEMNTAIGQRVLKMFLRTLKRSMTRKL